MHETLSSSSTNFNLDNAPNHPNQGESLPEPEIRHLNPETDDLAKAATLLFQVDPYICPDFFGDSATAEKMGPILFNQPGSLFDASRVLVAERANQLLGILVYADNTVQSWDCAKVKSELLNHQIALPKHFDRANKEYMAAVSEEARTFADGVMEIEFLATDSSARGQGIGSKLFQTVLDLPYREQRLTVLADNAPALHLYEKLGFTITSSQTGYPDDSVKTHNMVRKSAEQ